MKNFRVGLFAVAVTISLVGCGGGGGGTVAPAVSTELNRFASFAYVSKPGTTCMPYEGQSYEAVVTSVGTGIGTAKRTFRVIEGLPAGMSLNTSTGTITGVPQNLNGSTTGTKVELTVDGFTGTQQASLAAIGRVFTGFTSGTGGFAVSGSSSFTGTRAVAGTILGGPTINAVACGGSSLDPIPARYIVQYGLGANTTVGATVNAATGVFSWTPPATGTFTFERFLDLTINGQIGRVTDTYTITVI